MHVHAAFILLAALLCGVQALSVTEPRAVPLTSVTCKAPNRAVGEIKDIRLRYLDINPEAERTLLLVHGWPGLWHVWKNQIEYFKDDYHLVVPNQRGFGGSEHPGDLETSSLMGDLVADLICVLEDAKVSKAVCIGHDWGTQVCNEAARMRPDIFEAVIGTCIPYIPYDGRYIPIETFVPVLPKLAYNSYFQNHTAEAVAELNTDIRRSLRSTMRSVNSPPPDTFLTQTDSYLQAWDSVPVIPPIPFFTPDEEDYWVEEFQANGYNFTLGFYTYGTRHGSWQQAHEQGNFTIPQPALSILSSQDPVADWATAAKLLNSSQYLLNLTTKTVPAAHWLQLERPDEVNDYLRKWLDEYYPPQSDHEGTHPRDEL